jgi:hypothetical protein
MTDDVFSSDDQQNSGVLENSGETPNVLEALVGDGKKFASVEELAEGKAKADEHITKIEAENAELREQIEAVNKQATLTELIDAVKANAQNSEGKGDETMSTEDLENAIRNVLSSVSESDTKDANRAKGNVLVLEQVGGDVEAAKLLVAERAAAIGMTPADLRDLSEKSPEAFAKLIEKDSDGTPSNGSPTALPGQQNTDALDGNTEPLEIDGVKTKAWFDAKRKEIGHVKYINDAEIQRELVRSMNELGDRFNT